MLDNWQKLDFNTKYFLFYEKSEPSSTENMLSNRKKIIPLYIHKVPFVWTAACQTALDMIKHAVTNSPVLTYPDPNKQYHLFTDASKHTWSGVLTQTRETLKENGKLDITYHPITYQSGMFTLSQINWSTLVKEAYVIMMLFCKMTFYFHNAEVFIQSYHAPFRT